MALHNVNYNFWLKFIINLMFPSSSIAHSVAPQAPSSQATAPSSFLQNRSIEEIITKWTQDLDAHLREFKSQALAIGKVDDALIAQGKKVSFCYV